MLSHNKPPWNYCTFFLYDTYWRYQHLLSTSFSNAETLHYTSSCPTFPCKATLILPLKLGFIIPSSTSIQVSRICHKVADPIGVYISSVPKPQVTLFSLLKSSVQRQRGATSCVWWCVTLCCLSCTCRLKSGYSVLFIPFEEVTLWWREMGRGQRPLLSLFRHSFY